MFRIASAMAVLGGVQATEWTTAIVNRVGTGTARFMRAKVAGQQVGSETMIWAAVRGHLDAEPDLTFTVREVTGLDPMFCTWTEVSTIGSISGTPYGVGGATAEGLVSLDLGSVNLEDTSTSHMVLDITDADDTTIGCGVLTGSTQSNVVRAWKRVFGRTGLTPTDELSALL